MAMNPKKELLIRALDGKGEVLNLLGRYDEAIDSFQKVLKYSKNSHLTLAKSKRKIADIYCKQGDYDIALGMLEKAQIFLTGDTLEEQLERAEIYISRCFIYRMKGGMKEALIEGKTGLEIVDGLSGVTFEQIEIERKKVIARGSNNLGIIFQTKGEYDKAIELYRKSLKISEEIGDKQGIADAINNLGTFYYNKGEYDKAIELYQKRLQISEEIGDKLSIGMVSANLGNVYYDKGEFDKAIELYQKRLQISEEIGDKRGIGIANLNLGGIYYVKGEYGKATELFEKCLRIFEDIDYKQGIGLAVHNLGLVYSDKAEYDKAIELFQKDLRISEEIGDKQGIGVAIGSLGNTYFVKGEYDKAIELFQKNLRIYEEVDDKRGIGIASFHLGGLFLELGELKKAEEHLLVAKNVLTEIGDKFFLIDAFTEIAELKIKQNFIIEALKYADNAFKLAQELGSKHDKARALLMQARIFHQGLLRGIKGDRGLSGVGADARWQIADMKFKEAIKIFEELKQPFELAKAYYYYGEMLKSETLKQVQGDSGRKGEKGKANEYLQKAREIFEKIGAKQWFAKVKELCSKTKN